MIHLGPLAAVDVRDQVGKEAATPPLEACQSSCNDFFAQFSFAVIADAAATAEATIVRAFVGLCYSFWTCVNIVVMGVAWP